MRLGFRGDARYIASRDFWRQEGAVRKGDEVKGTRATLRRFYRQRKIDKVSEASKAPAKKKKAKETADE